MNLATAVEFQAEIARLQAEIERLRLTDAEREAIGLSIPAMQYAADELGLSSAEFDGHADTLRGLLSKVGSPSRKVGSPRRQGREAAAQSREAGQPVLTDAEREAVEYAAVVGRVASDLDREVLRGLLDRTGTVKK